MEDQRTDAGTHGKARQARAGAAWQPPVARPAPHLLPRVYGAEAAAPHHFEVIASVRQRLALDNLCLARHLAGAGGGQRCRVQVRLPLGTQGGCGAARCSHGAQLRALCWPAPLPHTHMHRHTHTHLRQAVLGVDRGHAEAAAALHAAPDHQAVPRLENIQRNLLACTAGAREGADRRRQGPAGARLRQGLPAGHLQPLDPRAPGSSRLMTKSGSGAAASVSVAAEEAAAAASSRRRASYSSGNDRSSRCFREMVQASARPTCSTVRHMGHLLLWSMARPKHTLQKLWPHGVVTGGGGGACSGGRDG